MSGRFFNTIKIALEIFACICLGAISVNAQTESRVRVAVIDFGESSTGARAAERVREALTTDKIAVESGIVLIDRHLAHAAARGNGFKGSLNLTTQEARDLGAAIGCDFFIIGEADTVKRSPSSGSNYFESYAAIFIVSARTGRLVSWQRSAKREDTADQAERDLLTELVSGETNRYRVLILRASENEASARAAAVETPPAHIEVMSDDDNSKNDTQAPRPYRRLKPPYPDVAAQAEVEAVVDALVDIDARGEVRKVEIARWAGYGLDKSVIDTVKQMHFFPAMREGVAIPMRVLLRYNFHRTTLDQSTSNPDAPKKKIIIKPRP
ncbi:MAG TPA: TonB family protein [Pyrinomonadaceae bacterium]|nr:TonB family protein [Pyrinomonadaceae bacterium]